MAVVDSRSRWNWVLLALVVGVLVGGAASSLVRTEPLAERPAPGSLWPDEAPDVVGVRMASAIDTLVDAGFRVVAVGDGRIKLQELGVRGHVLRIQGWAGSELRYCTARLPDCVSIPSGDA